MEHPNSRIDPSMTDRDQRLNETSSGPAKPKAAPVLDAAKVSDASRLRDKSCVVYWVKEVAQTTKDQERRGPQRKRTRLRCGKVLDGHSELIIECQVHDRSTYGARLRLMNTLPLPPRIRVYDDEHGALLEAKVIWQKDDSVGVQFLTEINARTKRLGKISKYAGKYYAL
jgi:hypothetical protein